MRIAYAKDDLLSSLLMKLTASAVAKIFSDQSQSCDGIGRALLRIRSKTLETVFVRHFGYYSGFSWRHFLSHILLEIRCDFRFHFTRYRFRRNSVPLAAIEIVDAQFVVITEAFGQSVTHVGILNNRHGFVHQIIRRHAGI